ncbi:MAG TPA: phage holin family protein [Gemmatimonadaceae bacterium]|nr:phage holin family protein [Gemmatimonadaceae bacterium]
MAVSRFPANADAGIPDLIHRLGDDSKRLVIDEVQLAKLEITESVHAAGKGAMWLGIAFGAAVVAMVAATLLLTTLIGRVVAGHMWVGALATAVIELALSAYVISRGVAAFKKPSYSLVQTRKTIS